MEFINLDYLWIAALALIPGLVSIGIMLYVWRKFPRSLTTTLFIWFIGFCAGWQLMEGTVRLLDDVALVSRIHNLVWTFAILTVATGLHFSMRFAGMRKITRSLAFLLVNYGPGIFYIAGYCLGFNTRMVESSETWHWLSFHDQTFACKFLVYWLAFQSILTFSTLGYHALKQRSEDRSSKLQALIIFIGYLIPAITGIFTQVLMPVAFGFKEVPITTTTNMAFALATFIALKNFGLFKYIPLDTRHQILNSMAEGITVIDNDGQIRFVNDRFCQMLGFTEQELLGMNAHKLVHEVEKSVDLREILEQRRSGEANQYQIALASKDGQVMDIQVSGAPYKDNSGKIIGCLGIHTDITQQVRADRMLKSALKITRAAGRGIRDTKTLGELICRELNKFLEVSSFFMSLTEDDSTDLQCVFRNYRDGERIRGRKLSSILADMVRDRSESVHVRDLNALFPTKTLSRQFIGCPMKHLGHTIGVIGIIGSHSQKFTAQDLEVVEYIAQQIASTIDRQKVLEQLTKSQEQLQLADTIIRNVGNYVLAANEEGQVFFASRSVETGLGYTLDDIEGEKWFKLGRSSVDKRQKVEYIQRAARGLENLSDSYETWTKDKLGRERCILWQDTRAPGDILIGIGVDITDQKLAHMKVEEEKKHAIQYQSMLLSSQINPHFIFNSLNSVQYYIMDQNVEPALNYISEFSRLMRSVLQNSLHRTITLADEVDFLEMYLQLEMKRFHDKFSYEIILDENIDASEFHIPPMLLQPYVENTVVHGIGNKEGRGHVQIKFKSYGDLITCSIEDDGVGRDRAKELKALRVGKSQKSLGMGITQTRLSLLNDLENDNYSVRVHDLKDLVGEPRGTRIDIQFPACVA